AAARLQVRVSREGYQPEQALHERSRRTGQEVADWFAGAQPVAARALMIAIAVFEHRPYAEVRQAAFALERRMHDPDLRWIWRYWPPNLFADARDGRLDQVRAEVRTSSADDHDVVRFVRPGWGAEVLDCVWRQYERLRPVLRDWLEAFCLETSSYGADAHRRAAEVLGNLVGRERDPDPVGDFESWAESPKSILREMAAAALGRIAEAQQPRNAGLVRHRLNDWSAPGSPVAKRLTAALAYGRAFGVTQPRYALRQLGSLTKRSDAHLRDVIIQGVLALVREPANRPEVLEELVEWTSPTNAWTRRQVGLASALWVLGLAGGSKADNRVYRVGITDDERTRTLTRALLRNLMDDRRLRPKITSGLLDWAACAEREPALVPGFRSLLHAALAPPDDQVSRRISFDIRRLLYDEPETVGPLCTSVDEVLGRFAQ
ncbi:MAG: hypothetical protein ACRDQ5_09705, partial [Sciscionella sp.]